MPIPTSRNTLYANGQAIASADLNDIQDWLCITYGLSKALAAGVVGDMMHRPSGATLRPLGRAAALYTQVAGAAPTMRFRGGLVVQGGGPAEMPFLCYRLVDNEISLAVGNHPGVGQHRRDIISARLVYTAPGIVTLQTQMTQGVAAGSEGAAVDPATPAGYTKLASVYLTGAGPGSADVTKVRDFRVPLGRRIFNAICRDPMTLLTGTEWSITGFGMTSDGAAARHAWFYPPSDAALWGLRLMRIGLIGLMPAGPAVAPIATLVRHDMTDTLPSTGEVTLATLTADLVTSEATMRYREAQLDATPFWGNGYQSGLLNEPTADPRVDFPMLGLHYTSSSNMSDALRLIRWEFAGFLADEIA